MKRVLLISALILATVSVFGRKNIAANATVVADTIFYSEASQNVAQRAEASHYRLLMVDGTGANKRDLFRDFYLNGNLKAEGEYSFIDLNDDKNTVFNGEITTYYINGKEKWRGTYKNGQRNGYFTLQMRDGSVAVAEFVNGKSKHDYFTVTKPDGTMQKRPIAEIRSLLNI